VAPPGHRLVLAAAAVGTPVNLALPTPEDVHTKVAPAAVLAALYRRPTHFLLVLLADLMLAQLEVGVLLVLLRAAVRQVALEPHFKWPAAAALVAILQEQ